MLWRGKTQVIKHRVVVVRCVRSGVRNYFSVEVTFGLRPKWWQGKSDVQKECYLKAYGKCKGPEVWNSCFNTSGFWCWPKFENNWSKALFESSERGTVDRWFRWLQTLKLLWFFFLPLIKSPFIHQLSSTALITLSKESYFFLFF